MRRGEVLQEVGEETYLVLGFGRCGCAGKKAEGERYWTVARMSEKRNS